MKNIIFIGTNKFASYILQNLIKKNIQIKYVITKIDKKKGRGQKFKKHPTSNIANKNKIPIFKTKNINEIITEKFIKSINPKLIIMTDYGEKIKNNIINIPKYNIINIHPSLLPKLKGPTPIQHAIIKNDKFTGVSLIKINENIDSGNLLNAIKYKIKKTDTYLSLSKKLSILGVKCLIKTISDLKKNKIKFKKQDKKKASYTEKIEKSFFKINWFEQAINIHKKIRAAFGIKKIYTFAENNEIKIIKIKIIYEKKNTYNPGVIIKINTSSIDIKSKDHIIKIIKIQFPGKKINLIKNVLNSNKKIFKTGNNLYK